MGGGRAGSAGQDTMLEHGTRGDAMDSSKEHSEMGGFATHLPVETDDINFAALFAEFGGVSSAASILQLVSSSQSFPAHLGHAGLVGKGGTTTPQDRDAPSSDGAHRVGESVPVTHAVEVEDGTDSEWQFATLRSNDFHSLDHLETSGDDMHDDTMVEAWLMGSSFGIHLPGRLGATPGGWGGRVPATAWGSTESQAGLVPATTLEPEGSQQKVSSSSPYVLGNLDQLPHEQLRDVDGGGIELLLKALGSLGELGGIDELGGAEVAWFQRPQALKAHPWQGADSGQAGGDQGGRRRPPGGGQDGHGGYEGRDGLGGRDEQGLRGGGNDGNSDNALGIDAELGDALREVALEEASEQVGSDRGNVGGFGGSFAPDQEDLRYDPAKGASAQGWQGADSGQVGGSQGPHGGPPGFGQGGRGGYEGHDGLGGLDEQGLRGGGNDGHSDDALGIDAELGDALREVAFEEASEQVGSDRGNVGGFGGSFAPDQEDLRYDPAKGASARGWQGADSGQVGGSQGPHGGPPGVGQDGRGGYEGRDGLGGRDEQGLHGGGNDGQSDDALGIDAELGDALREVALEEASEQVGSDRGNVGGFGGSFAPDQEDLRYDPAKGASAQGWQGADSGQVGGSQGPHGGPPGVGQGGRGGYEGRDGLGGLDEQGLRGGGNDGQSDDALGIDAELGDALREVALEEASEQVGSDRGNVGGFGGSFAPDQEDLRYDPAKGASAQGWQGADSGQVGGSQGPHGGPPGVGQDGRGGHEGRDGLGGLDEQGLRGGGNDGQSDDALGIDAELGDALREVALEEASEQVGSDRGNVGGFGGSFASDQEDLRYDPAKGASAQGWQGADSGQVGGSQGPHGGPPGVGQGGRGGHEGRDGLGGRDEQGLRGGGNDGHSDDALGIDAELGDAHMEAAFKEASEQVGSDRSNVGGFGGSFAPDQEDLRYDPAKGASAQGWQGADSGQVGGSQGPHGGPPGVGQGGRGGYEGRDGLGGLDEQGLRGGGNDGQSDDALGIDAELGDALREVAFEEASEQVGSDRGNVGGFGGSFAPDQEDLRYDPAKGASAQGWQGADSGQVGGSQGPHGGPPGVGQGGRGGYEGRDGLGGRDEQGLRGGGNDGHSDDALGIDAELGDALREVALEEASEQVGSDRGNVGGFGGSFTPDQEDLRYDPAKGASAQGWQGADSGQVGGSQGPHGGPPGFGQGGRGGYEGRDGLGGRDEQGLRGGGNDGHSDDALGIDAELGDALREVALEEASEQVGSDRGNVGGFGGSFAPDQEDLRYDPAKGASARGWQGADSGQVGGSQGPHGGPPGVGQGGRGGYEGRDGLGGRDEQGLHGGGNDGHSDDALGIDAELGDAHMEAAFKEASEQVGSDRSNVGGFGGSFTPDQEDLRYDPAKGASAQGWQGADSGQVGGSQGPHGGLPGVGQGGRGGYEGRDGLGGLDGQGLRGGGNDGQSDDALGIDAELGDALREAAFEEASEQIGSDRGNVGGFGGSFASDQEDLRYDPAKGASAQGWQGADSGQVGGSQGPHGGPPGVGQDGRGGHEGRDGLGGLDGQGLRGGGNDGHSDDALGIDAELDDALREAALEEASEQGGSDRGSVGGFGGSFTPDQEDLRYDPAKGASAQGWQGADSGQVGGSQGPHGGPPGVGQGGRGGYEGRDGLGGRDEQGLRGGGNDGQSDDALGIDAELGDALREVAFEEASEQVGSDRGNVGGFGGSFTPDQEDLRYDPAKGVSAQGWQGADSGQVGGSQGPHGGPPGIGQDGRGGHEGRDGLGGLDEQGLRGGGNDGHSDDALGIDAELGDALREAAFEEASEQVGSDRGNVGGFGGSFAPDQEDLRYDPAKGASAQGWQGADSEQVGGSQGPHGGPPGVGQGGRGGYEGRDGLGGRDEQGLRGGGNDGHSDDALGIDAELIDAHMEAAFEEASEQVGSDRGNVGGFGGSFAPDQEDLRYDPAKGVSAQGWQGADSGQVGGSQGPHGGPPGIGQGGRGGYEGRDGLGGRDEQGLRGGGNDGQSDDALGIDAELGDALREVAFEEASEQVGSDRGNVGGFGGSFAPDQEDLRYDPAKGVSAQGWQGADSGQVGGSQGPHGGPPGVGQGGRGGYEGRDGLGGRDGQGLRGGGNDGQSDDALGIDAELGDALREVAFEEASEQVGSDRGNVGGFGGSFAPDQEDLRYDPAKGVSAQGWQGADSGQVGGSQGPHGGPPGVGQGGRGGYEGRDGLGGRDGQGLRGGGNDGHSDDALGIDAELGDALREVAFEEASEQVGSDRGNVGGFGGSFASDQEDLRYDLARGASARGSTHAGSAFIAPLTSESGGDSGLWMEDSDDLDNLLVEVHALVATPPFSSMALDVEAPFAHTPFYRPPRIDPAAWALQYTPPPGTSPLGDELDEFDELLLREEDGTGVFDLLKVPPAAPRSACWQTL